MTTRKGERTDKFLWCVRLYKSRSAATEACRKGKVTVAGQPVKPAHEIAAGDILEIRKPPVTFTYMVLAIPNNRVGARLAPDYISDLTPQEEKNKLDTGKLTSGFRPRGTGRPTKKERRELDNFLE